MMSKLQTIIVSFSVLLFFVLYFGFDVKTKEHQMVEASRSFVIESTDITSLLRTVKSEMARNELLPILEIEEKLEKVSDATSEIQYLKELSGIWYKRQYRDIAGFYAEKVAELNEDAEAWSIAGSTYFAGIATAKTEKSKIFCSNRATKCFENAISLEPKENRHRVNLALCYVENPPQDNPMQGIKMLLDLNKQHPDDVSVLNNLGRLAIQTGQFDKAVVRLEKALNLEPENKKTNCLLAQVYQVQNKAEKALTFKNKCETLSAQ